MVGASVDLTSTAPQLARHEASLTFLQCGVGCPLEPQHVTHNVFLMFSVPDSDPRMTLYRQLFPVRIVLVLILIISLVSIRVYDHLKSKVRLIPGLQIGINV